MDELKIIPCGTKAAFGNIEGTICAVEITYSNVLYKLGYVDRDMNYKTLWCHEKELTIQSKKKLPIGFSTFNPNGHG